MSKHTYTHRLRVKSNEDDCLDAIEFIEELVILVKDQLRGSPGSPGSLMTDYDVGYYSGLDTAYEGIKDMLKDEGYW